MCVNTGVRRLECHRNENCCLGTKKGYEMLDYDLRSSGGASKAVGSGVK
jgi:hypothetical protein